MGTEMHSSGQRVASVFGKKGVLYLHTTKRLADAKRDMWPNWITAEQMSKQRWTKVLPITWEVAICPLLP